MTIEQIIYIYILFKVHGVYKRSIFTENVIDVENSFCYFFYPLFWGLISCVENNIFCIKLNFFFHFYGTVLKK